MSEEKLKINKLNDKLDIPEIKGESCTNDCDVMVGNTSTRDGCIPATSAYECKLW